MLLSAQVTSGSNEKVVREARSARYNGGRCDLTVPGRDCFFEHFAPGALPLIPLKESTLALLGTVTTVKPYLSADRTHIYTETTIQVEEVFKSPDSFTLPPDRTLITDQIGGAMRMASGRVIRDGSVVDFIGKTYVGGRYVFFLRQVHDGKDIAILSAYELRDGKVFKLTEDGRPGTVLLSRTPNQPDSLSDEQGLLQTLRRGDTVDSKTGNLHLTRRWKSAGWPTLCVTSKEAAPPFAVFEGWKYRIKGGGCGKFLSSPLLT
jgi:hypothetical protein